jgi:hypothetical protein
VADRPLPPVDEVDDEFIKKALDCGPGAPDTTLAVNIRRALYEAKAAKSWPEDELAARRAAARRMEHDAFDRKLYDDFARWQRGELPPKPGDRG